MKLYQCAMLDLTLFGMEQMDPPGKGRNQKTKMKEAASYLLLAFCIIAVINCAGRMEQALKGASAGNIGCPPDAIQISNINKGTQTWQATCNEKIYYCSWMQDDASCKEGTSRAPVQPLPPQPLENTLAACQDTLDNDGDGHTDCDDQDCQIFAVCVE